MRQPDRARSSSRSRRPVAVAAVASAAVLGGVVTALPAEARASAEQSPHVLRTSKEGFVTHLGPVRVNARNATLANAYRAFGRPSSSSGRGTVRRVRWKAAGVSIVATTLGGCRRRTRCRTDELYVGTARVSGPRWQTSAGLKVGDPVARITELYPDAEPPTDGSGGLVVQEAYYPYGDGGYAPTITAKVRAGVVSGFAVVVGAQGE
jgi:hypothetical protein